LITCKFVFQIFLCETSCQQSYPVADIQLSARIHIQSQCSSNFSALTVVLICSVATQLFEPASQQSCSDVAIQLTTNSGLCCESYFFLQSGTCMSNRFNRLNERNAQCTPCKCFYESIEHWHSCIGARKNNIERPLLLRLLYEA
jgi:hypothetical protein